jgi:heme-degrading monooxygenase HmoA
MLVRVVQLTFKSEELDGFFEAFEVHKHKIASFEGCRGMQLLQEIDNPCVVMTYSHWEDEGALNAYRSSELFSNLWANIKPKFSKKPEAWSHVIYFDGFDRNQELSL